MKKILFFITLFVLLLIPQANASTFYQYAYWNDSGLTKEQKQEYLDFVLNDPTFIADSKQYNYYMIVYHKKNGSPFGSGYDEVIDVMFFNDYEQFKSSISKDSLSLEFPLAKCDKTYFYYIDTRSINNMSLNRLYLFNLDEQVKTDNDTYVTWYFYNIDFVLGVNFTFTLDKEVQLYDSNKQFMYTIKADDNIFDTVKVTPNQSYTLDDIEAAEDKIHSLSKSILGNLPVEFEFLYILLDYFIAILIIITVLSPFIILFKLIGR